MKQIVLLIGLVVFAQTLSLHETTNTTNTTSTSALCGYNSLFPLPITKEHTYSLKATQTVKYSSNDFAIVDPKNSTRNDSFVDWLGKNANFKDNFPKMLCRVADKQVLETVCKINKTQIESVFQQRFGLDIIFKCRVPKSHIVIAVQYPLKVGDLEALPSDKWSTLGGIYEYKNETETKKVIETEGSKISKELKDSKVDIWSLEKGLAETDQQIQQELADTFNTDLASGFVKNVKANTPADLVRIGTIKILYEGTDFVVGAIQGGTNHLKQLCDGVSVTSKDNCSLNLNK